MPSGPAVVWAGNEQSDRAHGPGSAARREQRARSRRRQDPRPALRRPRRHHGGGHGGRRRQPLLRPAPPARDRPDLRLSAQRRPRRSSPAPRSATPTGLVLVVPLGDLHPRRRLVVIVYCVAAVALVCCAVAPDLWLFGVASVLTGCCLGGRPDHGPLRGGPGLGRAPGAGGGPDHDRPVDRHPLWPAQSRASWPRRPGGGPSTGSRPGAWWSSPSSAPGAPRGPTGRASGIGSLRPPGPRSALDS